MTTTFFTGLRYRVTALLSGRPFTLTRRCRADGTALLGQGKAYSGYTWFGARGTTFICSTRGPFLEVTPKANSFGNTSILVTRGRPGEKRSTSKAGSSLANHGSRSVHPPRSGRQKSPHSPTGFEASAWRRWHEGGLRVANSIAPAEVA